MSIDRVDVSADVPSEGAMRGVYSMRDARRLECGGIEASTLPAPLASETDEAVAEWQTAAAAPKRDRRTLQFVEGASNNPLLLMPAKPGFRYVWSKASNDATLVKLPRAAANAVVAVRTKVDCALVWARFMDRADSSYVPMSAVVAQAQ